MLNRYLFHLYDIASRNVFEAETHDKVIPHVELVASGKINGVVRL